MSPLLLAVWIMDDGGWIKDRGLRLCNNSYTLYEVKYLIKLLEDKFSLKNLTAVSAGNPEQYIIYIPKNNISALLSIVESYIHPIFLLIAHELFAHGSLL